MTGIDVKHAIQKLVNEFIKTNTNISIGDIMTYHEFEQIWRAYRHTSMFGSSVYESSLGKDIPIQIADLRYITTGTYGVVEIRVYGQKKDGTMSKKTFLVGDIQLFYSDSI